MNENLEYAECLYEMASIRPKGSINDLGILLAVNPDVHIGDVYFKMYDSTSFYTAETVWRIRFDSPELIKIHKGKIKASITMSSEYKKKLVAYLQLDSKDFKGYKVWDELKYRWNVEKGLMDQYGFLEYVSGVSDSFYKGKKNKDYIPYDLAVPDYTKLK